MIGVCGAPFKCPPAPSECALLLHDQLAGRGVRDACEITLILPFGTPVPPSPETSAALIAAFAERGIRFVPGRKVSSLDLARKRVVLDDGTEVPYDLFLGVPKQRAPDVVLRERPDRGRLHPRRPGDARDPLPGRLRHRGRRNPGDAEGRRVRGRAPRVRLRHR